MQSRPCIHVHQTQLYIRSIEGRTQSAAYGEDFSKTIVKKLKYMQYEC